MTKLYTFILILLMSMSTAWADTSKLCEGQPVGCDALFAPIIVDKAVLASVMPPKEPKVAGEHTTKAKVVNKVSKDGDLSTIEFTSPILKELTPEYIKGIKDTKADQLKYLAELEVKYGFPEGTLRVKWFIESMAGKLNIKNKFGYEGHFQVGAYEQKKYGIKDPYNFKEAAHGTIRLSRAYHVLLQGYSKDIIRWEDRSISSFYTIHQQGFMGLGTQYNAMHHDTVLLKRVRRNMCNNIPVPYYKMVCAPGNKKHGHISDKQLSTFFTKMWESEVNRIWTEIQK